MAYHLELLNTGPFTGPCNLNSSLYVPMPFICVPMPSIQPFFGLAHEEAGQGLKALGCIQSPSPPAIAAGPAKPNTFCRGVGSVASGCLTTLSETGCAFRVHCYSLTRKPTGSCFLKPMHLQKATRHLRQRMGRDACGKLFFLLLLFPKSLLLPPLSCLLQSISAERKPNQGSFSILKLKMKDIISRTAML